jgi:hypothetical protein
MAKPKKAAKRLIPDNNVRRIRSQYATALRAGYSVAEASKFANESEPKKIASDELPNVLKGSAKQNQPSTEMEIEIPPNWDDLPWPDLKSLAERLTGGQQEIKSRRQAGAIIREAKNGE